MHNNADLIFLQIKLRSNFPAALLELAKCVCVLYNYAYCIILCSYRATVTKQEHRAALVLGRRYTGVEAHTAGIVDEVCPPEQLREVALAAAGRLAGTEGLDRRTLTALKHDLYKDVIQALSDPPKFYSRI